MRFGILVFPVAEELDFIGPWELIGSWGRYFQGPKPILIAQRPEPVTCANGLRVVPDVTFDDCPSLDYLLVPGGDGTRKEVNNDVLIGFIAGQATLCKAVLSVCTGSILLQRAGLLDGKRATTHCMAFDRLRAGGQAISVSERFVRDGDVWTAAGVSAGMDMTLAFIADVAGEEIAGKLQLAAEYYPSTRLYGQAHVSSLAPEYLKNQV